MSNIIAERPGWYIRNKWFVWWGVLFGIVGAIGVAIWCAEPPDRPALAINALIAIATLALVLATIQYNHKHLAEITGKASLVVLHPPEEQNSCYLAPIRLDSGLQVDAVWFRLPVTARGKSVEQVEVFASKLQRLDGGNWQDDGQWIPSPLRWVWPGPVTPHTGFATGSIRFCHFGFVVDPTGVAPCYRHSDDPRVQLYVLVGDPSFIKQNVLPCGRYKMVIELSAKGATVSKWELEFELKGKWTTDPVSAMKELLVFEKPRLVTA